MKNSRRSRLFDVFLVVTLFIGIALFILPFAFDWEQTNQRAHSETTYKQAYIPQPDGLQAKIDAYNAMIFAQQQKRPSSKVAITSVQKDLRDPIGYLDIPAIKLRAMTIYYGDSDWVLNRALGTLPFTSLPTGGKNTLGGDHRPLRLGQPHFLRQHSLPQKRRHHLCQRFGQAPRLRSGG